jgi:ADP-heptose:LPS heptosyltransferase
LTLKSPQNIPPQSLPIPEVESVRQELQRISHILLVRLRSLGDALLTLPLIEALHQWRPTLKLSILIEAPYAPVFQHHPAIDETLILKSGKYCEGWSRLHTIFELRKRHYPAVLNLHGGTTSMLFTWASGAPLRLGQASHRASWMYTQQIPSSAAIWKRQPLHTVEHQLSFMRWLDLPIAPTSSGLYVDESARTHIKDRLAAAGISEFILVQPTATLRTKQWEPAKFAQLGDWLAAMYRLPVVYTSALHEKFILKEIAQSAREQHTYWSDLPLADLFALIERCRFFVGCDSGPTHAAAALQKPIVVVWGSSNFQAWHPWGTTFEVVRSDLPCMPCPGYSCEAFGEPKCIRDIPVERVAAACKKIGDAPLLHTADAGN